MITPHDLKALILATPILLGACCDTKRTNAILPPAWMMEPPEQTEFIEPLESLTLGAPQKKTPQS